jgi:hypothetical protein
MKDVSAAEVASAHQNASRGKLIEDESNLNNARFCGREAIAAGKLVDNPVNSGPCPCSRFVLQGLRHCIEIEAADINFRNVRRGS